MKRKMTVSDWVSLFLEIFIGVIVLVFIGSQSLNFFSYVFPPEQWYLAYTGFGLTSLAALAYLFLLLKNAKTGLKKTVAMFMVIIGVAGELATGGFGMQVEAWKKTGFTLTESDFGFMILAVRILIFAHAAALISYAFGDPIIEVLRRDDDADGVPDVIDPVDNRTGQPNDNVFGRLAQMFQRTQDAPATLAPMNSETEQPVLVGQGSNGNIPENHNKPVNPTQPPRQ